MNVMNSMLVQGFLESSADRLPGKLALVCGERRLTYAQLEDQANRLAHVLRRSGVEPGDRVAVFLPNSAEAVIAIFGVLKAGAAFVCINHTTKRDKLLYILNDCGATVLITDSKSAVSALAVGAPVTLKQIVFCGAMASVTGSGSGSSPSLAGWDESLASVRSTRPPPVGVDRDLACLIYTSGTTGEPKGVMCAHDNIVFATHAIVDYLGNNQDDVVLSVLALSFTYGIYQVFAAVLVGATVVLESSFAFPVTILQRMEQERVTGFPGVPTIYAVLLRMDLRPFNLTRLRYLTNAAAPLAPDAVVAISRRFPQARFFSMYGQTETARTLFLPPEWLERKPGSVGLAIPGTEVWLEDEQGRRVGPGGTGELIVRGRHVMRGYWNAPAATAERFREEPRPGQRVCRTGDLFRSDHDGFLYFVSRRDDIIKCKGEKVAPTEVENALLRIPGIVSAAVVGVPDPICGQAVKAVLVAETPVPSLARVLAHCRAHLEDHMIPKFIEFRTELPRTANGKIKRSDLIPCAA